MRLITLHANQLFIALPHLVARSCRILAVSAHTHSHTRRRRLYGDVIPVGAQSPGRTRTASMRPRLQCASVVGIAAVVVAIVGLLQLPQPSVAVCQECGTDSGVLCWNETAFSICIGGVVSAADPSAVHVCPLGTVCFDGPTICGNSDDTIADCPPTTTTTATTAAANRCNECSTDRRYGCLSATTFGLCFGTVAVSMAVVVECPAGMWCDVEDGAFCTNDSTVIARDWVFGQGVCN